MSVFGPVLDPDAFGGGVRYAQQMGWLARACRSSQPRPGVDRVRVPGELALASKRDALDRGVGLSDSTLKALADGAHRLGLQPPAT